MNLFVHCRDMFRTKAYHLDNSLGNLLEGILNRWPKGKFVRFAEEVQTLEYIPEPWTSTSEGGGVRRKGDTGRLWKDEDSGESEGQEV